MGVRKVLGAVFLWGALGLAEGTDWPQFRGPTSDGKSSDRIQRPWTGTATNPVWRISLENGLCSFAVSGGRAFTQAKRLVNGVGKDFCLALSITNGSELWGRELGDALYPQGGVGNDDGPRSTPAVEGEAVFILTSYLKLYKLNITNGAVLWVKHLDQLYGATPIAWQNAASPRLDNGLIFLNANCGTQTLMALRTSDGSLAWRSQDEGMTHSTPTLATIFGVRQVIFATQAGLVSVDPATGDRLWKHPYPFAYGTSLSVSPVVFEDIVFVCAAHSYGMGALAVRLTYAQGAWSTAQLWYDTSKTCHWMTPVAHEGFLYGQFGIQQYDSPNAQLKCIDLRTGQVKWSTNGFGRSATIMVDRHLVTLTERGDLILSVPNTNAYTQLSRLQAITGYSGSLNKCWNGPAAAGGRLYVRSTAAAACFDFSTAGPPPLRLEPPLRLAPGVFRIGVGVVAPSVLDTNRLAGMSVRASSDVTVDRSQWATLTNPVVWSNGAAYLEYRDDPPRPQRYFLISEPE